MTADQQARLLDAAKSALALLISIGWEAANVTKQLRALIAEIEDD